jgi:hypothetical protein
MVERLNSLSNNAGYTYQRLDELFFDLQQAFVFREIPFPVCLVQHAPLFAGKIDCVLLS